jgi:hypothetical protein
VPAHQCTECGRLRLSGIISPDVVLGVPGDPAVSADPSNTAYEFTGGDPIVRVPAAAATDLNPGLAPLTISAHLKVPATLTAGDYNVLEKGTATQTGGAYKFEIMGKTSSSKFGFPDCAFNSAGVKQRVYGPRMINDGLWHTRGVSPHRHPGVCDRRRCIRQGAEPNRAQYLEHPRCHSWRKAQQHSPLQRGRRRSEDQHRLKLNQASVPLGTTTRQMLRPPDWYCRIRHPSPSPR